MYIWWSFSRIWIWYYRYFNEDARPPFPRRRLTLNANRVDANGKRTIFTQFCLSHQLLFSFFIYLTKLPRPLTCLSLATHDKKFFPIDKISIFCWCVCVLRRKVFFLLFIWDPAHPFSESKGHMQCVLSHKTDINGIQHSITQMAFLGKK